MSPLFHFTLRLFLPPVPAQCQNGTRITTIPLDHTVIFLLIEAGLKRS